ncbi:YCF48-related protein [Ahniella affigens]|nr:YCF48-related protein [Ahniella affigens]
MRNLRNALLVFFAITMITAGGLYWLAPTPKDPERPALWERQVDNAWWAKDQLADISDVVVLNDTLESTSLLISGAEGLSLVRGKKVRRVYAGATISGLAAVGAENAWAVGFDGKIVATRDGGSSWSVQTSGTNAWLNAVAFFDAKRGWAVGRRGTIVATRDGGLSWSVQDSRTTADLAAVSFVDAESGWAVGVQGTILVTRDGGVSWSTQDSETYTALTAVAFADAENGWAVGTGGTILATRDGGSSWSVQSSGTEEDFKGVAFFDASRGWAVGMNGTITATQDGGARWSAQASGTRNPFSSVAFADAKRVWAVASDGTIVATQDGGARWSVQISWAQSHFSSVAFSDAKRGWAVGSNGTIFATQDGGSSWSAQPSVTEAWLNAVAFADAKHGWAAGSNGTILATRDGGSNWLVQATGTDQEINGLAFTNAEHAWAVGREGTIVATRNGGASWSAQDSGTKAWLNGLAFADDQRGWAVGVEGTIVATQDGGSSWLIQDSGIAADLNAVAFVDAERGWAVGSNGTIVATQDGGSSWLVQPSGTQDLLFSVAFADAERGWAVGSIGTILATQDGGSSWSAQPSVTEVWLKAVTFADAKHGWAAGSNGTILATKDGGTSWLDPASGTDSLIYEVAFADAERGWAVGEAGTILATLDGGASWSVQTSGTTAILNGLTFVDAKRGWAVGRNGVIVATQNGGSSWSAQASGTDEWLTDVAFTDRDRGWAVGLAGTILATLDGGASWSVQTSGTTAVLSGLTFVDAKRGWAVGRNGVILATQDGGSSWSDQSSETEEWLTDVTFANTERGWAIGDKGTILVTRDGGASWSLKNSGTDADLIAVAFADAERSWVVGRGGTIVATRDGGASWSVQNSGTDATLTAVAFVDAERGWAVGPYTMIKSTDGGASWSAISPMRSTPPSATYWLLAVSALMLIIAISLSLVPQRDERGGEVASDAAIAKPDQDRLQAQRHAERLAAFFNHAGTNPPLTLAISGPWGSGKSSLMNLLANEMRRDGFRPIWINLWHQQDEAQLYTNLVRAIRRDGVPPWWCSSGFLLRTTLAVRRLGTWAALLALALAILVVSLYPLRLSSGDSWFAPIVDSGKQFWRDFETASDAGKRRRFVVNTDWLDGLSKFHGFDLNAAETLSIDTRLASTEPAEIAATNTPANSDPPSQHEVVQALLRPVWGRQFQQLEDLLAELHKDSPCSARTRPDAGVGKQLSCAEFHQGIDWLTRAQSCWTGTTACPDRYDAYRLEGWQAGVASLSHQGAKLSAGYGLELSSVVGLLVLMLTILPQLRALPGDSRTWLARLRSSFSGMPEGDPGLRHRFAQGLAELARHMQRRPLLIFFDDLDRLDGKRTLEFLECLNFLSTDHRAGYYIVGMDYERVVHTLAPQFVEEVKAKYGSADAEALREAQVRHARRYLQKLIHVVYAMPLASAAKVVEEAAPAVQSAEPGTWRDRVAVVRNLLYRHRGLLRQCFEWAGPLFLATSVAIVWWTNLDRHEYQVRPETLAAEAPAKLQSDATPPSIAPQQTPNMQPEALPSPPVQRSGGFNVPDRSIDALPITRSVWMIAAIPFALFGLALVYWLSTQKLKDPVNLREAYGRWFRLLPIETPRDAKRLANAIRVEAGLSRESLLNPDPTMVQRDIQQTIELVALASLTVLKRRMGELRFRSWGPKIAAAVKESGLTMDTVREQLDAGTREAEIDRVLRYTGLTEKPRQQ